MPLDLSVVKHTLSALADLQGHPLAEDALASEVEIRAGRPLTVQQVTEALTRCRDLGWAEWRTDDFNRRVWAITSSGAMKTRQS